MKRNFRTSIRVLAIAVGVVASSAYLAPAALAADVVAGKKLAQTTCLACHGMNGIGITDQYPDLAGQKAAYLAAQLKAFRDGSRSNAIMAPMAKALSDAAIENVSAYYSSLGCESKSP
ncbi:MAG TPA: cytochrome c [Pseudomonadales bacterium]|nr:cytochrome c [Pseudomonadales bacterium]